jgi:uncharacterized protein YqeY
MTIQETVKAKLKEAMIAKDSVALMALRGISSGFTNELVNKGIPPQEPISDEDAMTVLKREQKKRKDSIEQFVAGGREDLADSEKAELAIIEQFLPQMMSEAEIETIVKAKIAEAGTVDKTSLGKFTGMIIKELAGKADGADVKKVVDRLVQ